MGAEEQGANATAGRWLTIPRTLCFVFNGDNILLMKRAPHRRVFPNCYNGVGGHIERDEDPYTSAQREILEETGLRVGDLRLCAVYNIDAGLATGITLLVFTASSTTRKFVANHDEGTLHWVPKKEVLTLKLVEDLPILLPRLFAMKPDDPPMFVHVSYDDEDHILMRFAGE